MKTHRLTVAIASLFLFSTPALAMAVPADTVYPRPVPPTTDPTPSDYAAPKSGDTKFDAPGTSRAPQYDPSPTIQVVRPERTIVRDVDEELPVILAGLALLIAVGGAGFALVRTRRIAVGR
jgi:hypothetical protein